MLQLNIQWPPILAEVVLFFLLSINFLFAFHCTLYAYVGVGCIPAVVSVKIRGQLTGVNSLLPMCALGIAYKSSNVVAGV